MTRKYEDYLCDIIEAIRKIEKFSEDITLLEDFQKDEKTTLAIIRLLEIIGEAAKKIPLHIRKKYRHVPWKKMAGMRDKLIHEYFGINIKVVWETIKKELPQIKPSIERICVDYNIKMIPPCLKN
jgi:uncharacterized protein with HEPN domain